MGFTQIILALASVFIMLIPGFVFKKFRLVNDQQTGGIATILTGITYPCLIVNAMQMPASPAVLDNIKDIALITVGIMAIAFILSKLMGKLVHLPRSQSGLITFMLIFGNTGFIGLPIITGLLGKSATFYVIICDSTINLFMFTLGLMLLRSAANARQDLKSDRSETIKGIFNPCMIAVIIGLLLYGFQITLPKVIGTPIETIGAVTVPLAMFLVGAQLAEIKLMALIKSLHIYLYCVLKLLVVPLLTFLLVKFTIGAHSLLATVIIMEASMPAAMSSAIFTKQYKGDVEFATKGVLMSTLFCIITIPVLAIFLV